MTREQIIGGVATWTGWWLEERKDKLREHLSGSMSINPFLLPILFDFHSIRHFDDLADILIGSHLMIGHHTGFGKLIDEKILPEVFGTTKLDAKFRHAHQPYAEAPFDEIDHVVQRPDGRRDLLCLKAGKWTIQLTMAVQLNKAFADILERYGTTHADIIVGVSYGRADELTDKYDILRGINRGKQHDVADLQARVRVLAGRDFWSWLNGDMPETQHWLLQGIQEGLRIADCSAECSVLYAAFRDKIVKDYSKYISPDGVIDWQSLLKAVNG